jgi:AcrR family transcriptional regulator
MKPSRKNISIRANIRYQQFLDAAIKLAYSHGYMHVTAKLIARKLNTTSSLVLYYFEKTAYINTAILQAALEREDTIILAQALIRKDSRIKKKLSNEIKQKIIKFIMDF